MDDERAKIYADVVKKGYAARFAFAAAVFGETSEAYFWLQLPRAIRHLMNKLMRKSPQKFPSAASASGVDEASMPSKISFTGSSAPEARKIDSMVSFKIMFFFHSSHSRRRNKFLCLEHYMFICNVFVYELILPISMNSAMVHLD